jgi:hypothetical protein
MSWSSFVKRLALLTTLAWFGCQAPPAKPPDAGAVEEEPPVDYEGESSGSPPDFVGDIIDAGNRTPIDAGVAETDTRCCRLNFRIDVGDEPAGAVAMIVGQVAPLSPGLPLETVDGGYVASACFPMVSSSYYAYQFEWISSDEDAGGLSMGDGGYLMTHLRHSAFETSYPSPDGTRRNFIPAVENCAELDAGMGP